MCPGYHQGFRSCWLKRIIIFYSSHKFNYLSSYLVIKYKDFLLNDFPPPTCGRKVNIYLIHGKTRSCLKYQGKVRLFLMENIWTKSVDQNPIVPKQFSLWIHVFLRNFNRMSFRLFSWWNLSKSRSLSWYPLCNGYLKGKNAISFISIGKFPLRAICSLYRKKD